MYDYDKNIIALIDILILDKIIKSKSQFYEDIKILRQTITKIKQGINHFTPLQIEMICKKYNVNANWIFGIENEVFRGKKSNQKSAQNL